MNWKHAFTIMRKDLREAMANTSVWLPMLIVPLVFVIILPVVMILIPSQSADMMNDPDIEKFLLNMPGSISSTLAAYNDIQRVVVLMLGYMFAPMFLILPLMFSTTIAAESFAGERERKTMEALLYSPATDSELLVGKILAGLVPAIVVSWFSFLVYILVTNGVGWSTFGGIWFPLPHWWPLIFWVTPAISLLGVSMTVLISKKVKTFQGAYQTSASTVVLVLGLVAGQALGIIYLSVGLGMIMGLVFFIVDIVLVYLAVKGFNRKAILAGGD